MAEKLTGRDLFESERIFRLLVEGVADYALYMLSPAGIITNWNIGGQRIKGYAPEEIIGQHFSRFYAEADQRSGKPARALKLAKEHGRYEEDGWRVRKDGSFFWASVVIDAIYEDGDLIGFAKITRDISERREAQLKLEKMQRQLAESQKLDALGQLTGGIAHDFNNLLMIVSGNLHALKKVIGDDEKANRAVRAIETASKRGAALTRQLLTFARRQHVNPTSVDLATCVQTVREVLDTGIGSSVTLLMNIDDAIWPATVDVSEFETALVNLVINARDAMPDGGTIVVSVANGSFTDETDPGDYICVSVSDSGVGIPPDVIGKVFDPFFTTKPVGKGTGLGLSQVHGFVHQAGGMIKITSELGQGTRITMCLPRAEQMTQNGRENPVLIAANRTILLVEDNPDVAVASMTLLEQLGYSVRWASNADSALEEIEREEFDLVFSDIVMPGKIDGIALAQLIKEKHPAIPVLLATGYSEAVRDNKIDFPILRKPYELHDLSKAVGNLVRQTIN